MLNTLIFPLFFLVTFILAGMIIILRKQTAMKKQALLDANASSSSSQNNTIDALDPSQYYYSPWGWIQKKTGTTILLATDCHFNTDSTVECHFLGSPDLIKLTLDTDATGATSVIGGTVASVKMSRAQYSLYSFVPQGAVTPKCEYYFVPAHDATVLNVPRKSLILTNTLKELTYTPTCVSQNVVSGQNFIRACVGTLFFGDMYSSVPRCRDSNGTIRNVNDVENYIAKCGKDGVDPCTNDVQLSVLRFQANPNTTGIEAQIMYVEAPITLGAVGHETENPVVNLSQPLTLIPETTNGAPQQLFEVDRYNQKKVASVTGTYFRIRHQSDISWQLIVAPEPSPSGPLRLKFMKVGPSFSGGIYWTQLNAATTTGNAVFTYDYTNPAVPVNEKLDITRFKSRIESFNTNLLALVGPNNGINPGVSAVYKLVDMYNSLVTNNKIYVTTIESGVPVVQGLLDVISVIRKAANVVQGNSVGEVNFMYSYDAFDYLYELYYAATKLTTIPQINDRTQFLTYMENNFDHVFSMPMISEDLVISIIHNIVLNDLIPKVDSMLGIVSNDPILLLLKDTLVKISQVPSVAPGLSYLQKIVATIPNYLTVKETSFTTNWILIRDLLVANTNRIFNDRDTYNNIIPEFNDYKNAVIKLINDVQGHMEIISFINGGLVYCEKALTIPIASTEIYSWFITNQDTIPVYRVFRDGPLSYSIEQLKIQDLTYFGTINTSTSSTVFKSSLEMKNILGINSSTDVQVL